MSYKLPGEGGECGGCGSYSPTLSSELSEGTSLSPSQQKVFQITPLNLTEWFAVLCFSVPVIFLDEFLKYLSRSLGESPPTNHTPSLPSLPIATVKPKTE